MSQPHRFQPSPRLRLSRCILRFVMHLALGAGIAAIIIASFEWSAGR